MSLLTPLGLLGLIGVIALIIIYIIKPNYQSKFISSTHIWKLSLKYRKKRIPLSKLRNIILFICQVLILTAAAFVLTQPFIDDGAEEKDGEVVLIVDASASMQSSYGNGKSRAQRAVEAAYADAQTALENGYKVSLILASEKASFLLQQASNENIEQINDAFNKLLSDIQSDLDPNKNTSLVISNTTPDVKGAIKLAEQITAVTPNASVTFYTDMEYLYSGNVKIRDVKDPAEYNVAILDVRVTLVENYYRIEIDVVCYGADKQVSVYCDIADCNDDGKPLSLEANTLLSGDKMQTIVFARKTEEMPEIEADQIAEDIAVYAYDNINVYIDEEDAIADDNRFIIYGGHKPTLKIQYYSQLPNNYYTTALLVLKDALADSWNIEITEVGKDATPATEGFDLYIFEHSAPATVPTDGVVIYTNTQNIPSAAGIRIQQAYQNPQPFYLYPGESHPIMNNINPANVSVMQFLAVSSYDGYIPLMVFDTMPLLLLKEDLDQKILFMPFSLHYSNLALTAEFPLLLMNTINYFFPVAIDKYVYETGDKITVDITTNLLEVSGPETTLEFESFPAEWTVDNPGTYTLMRYAMSGEPIVEFIYVTLPDEESNTNLTVDKLEPPYFFSAADSLDLDLLFYFALAMVALLFIEWWLKSREQI